MFGAQDSWFGARGDLVRSLILGIAGVASKSCRYTYVLSRPDPTCMNVIGGSVPWV